MSNKDSSNKKMAVLVADAFQDSEYFLPKVEIEKMDVEMEVISIDDKPVEMWSFFDHIGQLKVDKSAKKANPEDYIGVMIPGGATSPRTLSKNKDVLNFIKELNQRGKLVASICRGSLPVAVSGIAKQRPITGYYLDDPEHPDQAIQLTVEEYGGLWRDDKPVVVDDNLITSRHPDDAFDFVAAIQNWIKDKEQ